MDLGRRNPKERENTGLIGSEALTAVKNVSLTGPPRIFILCNPHPIRKAITRAPAVAYENKKRRSGDLYQKETNKEPHRERSLVI
jgi:hypothetical protein